MGACEDILARLKSACESHYSKAWRDDDSYGTRKFVRKGILAAKSAIESVAPAGEPLAYLAAVRKAVEDARDVLRRNANDEDCWGPGAANTILGEIEKERRSLAGEPGQG